MTLLLLLAILAQDREADYDRNARRAVRRDAFPVLNNPKMVPANKAKGLKVRDPVLGVTVGKEAKAYPITILGIHELGNDTCGGKPIAVSW